MQNAEWILKIMREDNLIVSMSYAFALKVVNVYKYIASGSGERVMATQLLSPYSLMHIRTDASTTL